MARNLNPEATRDVERPFQIVETPIDAAEVTRRVEHPGNGAICVFFGVVRDHALSGRQTSFLEYEAFHEMAEAKMAEIAEAMRQRWGIERVAMTHRIGRLGIGEPSVVIAVGTPHRKLAFEACEYAIDRLKEEVPVWKKEIGPDGEEWVE
jgi:molybdopterin synthase catalytic subunit